MGPETSDGVPGLKSLWGPIFVAVVLTLLALVGLGLTWEWLFERTSEHSAIQDAGRSGAQASRAALEPFLTDDLIAGKTEARDKLAIAGAALIKDGGAAHVKVWSNNGQILWSDSTELIGRTFQLEAEEQALFVSRDTLVELRHDRLGISSSDTNHLEVAFGARTASDAPVVAEIDYPASLVQARAVQERQRFRPLLFVGLGLLTVAQVPLVTALARRRKILKAQRDNLVERFIAIGDNERRRIAAEIHDVAVQDLIGIAFSLSVAADEVDSPMKEYLAGAAEDTRRTVRNLRSLLTNIYPVQVPLRGWVGGLDAIINALRQRGVIVHVDVPDVQLSRADALLMLRVAREALNNIWAHAHASRVDIVMRHNGTMTSLQITDDGVGFDDDTAESQRQQGHLGLVLLYDLAADVGATFTVNKTPGTGTTVTLEICLLR